ncbi:MAG TPA: hypothetical protein VF475_15875 [Sphingobium sp.]
MSRAAKSWSRKGKLVSVVVAALATLSAAHARVAAGDSITNKATASFEVDGLSTSIASNIVATRIDEVLDVTLTPKSGGTVFVPPAGLSGFGVPLILTNTGNGTEAFRVQAQAPGQTIALSVAIDVDGNGAYDPAVDIILSGNSATLPIAPGADLALLLRFDAVPAQTGTVTVSAQATSGHGAPDSWFAGKGDNSSDAMVGRTSAAAETTIQYQLAATSTASAPATLAKSQTVRAPDGSATPVPGAVITYRLVLTTSGSETISDAEISDTIPVGTAYVPGSIRVEDSAASDAVDTDSARFDGQAIRIALGEISQPTTRVVTFQVIIL